MRSLHRAVGLVCGIMFLLLAGSGIWLQFEPNRMDAVLPGRMADAAVTQAFAARLQQLHRLRPNATLDSYEMNVSGPQPLIEFAFEGVPAGLDRLALDLRSGAVLPRQGELHARLVRFHNALMIGLPGRLLCLCAGIGLLYLCSSGLYFFWRLLIVRAGDGRIGPFWRAAGGTLLMRDAHRWITAVFAVLLLVIAGTGIAMQTGPTGLHLWPVGGTAPGPPPPGSAGLDDAAHVALLRHALAMARATDSDPRQLFMIDLGGGGDSARLSLTYASRRAGMYSRLFRARTVEEYPQPTGIFFLLLRLHRGDLFHDPGTWANILSGAALTALTLSGLVVYLDLFRRRVRQGRRALFW